MYKNIVSKLLEFYLSTVSYGKAHKTTSYAVLAVVVVFILYLTFSSSGIIAETTTVKSGPLVQKVLVTGQVQSSNEASLSFQTVGQVAYIGVKVGDVVTQGKVLATLSSLDAQASLLQAQATLQNAQATLDQLTQGSRPEEIAIKQQTVDNAKATLDQTYLTIPDGVRNVDAVTSDIVRNKFSSMFTYNGTGYVLSFSSCDQTLQNIIEANRTNIERTISDFQKKSSTISALSNTADIDSVFDQAYKVTSVTNDLVSSISTLLLSSCSATNSSLDAYRTNLTNVKTSMNTLFTDISSKRTALTTAKNTYTSAARDLALTKAGTDPYKLQAQQALVTSAEAQVKQAEANLSKTVVYAPFSGTISDVSVVRGETVTSGKTVISMLATNAFEVEAKVPEIDVVKIEDGSKVNITLDAYGTSVVFPATVTRVSPNSTTEGNVPMYKVLVTFIGEDPRIKSGMTANVNIITQDIKSTLSIPARFVTVIDQTKGMVIVRENKVDTVKDVTLGIRGEDGLIQITSGIKEGDVIVAPDTTVRSAQKQTQ